MKTRLRFWLVAVGTVLAVAIGVAPAEARRHHSGGFIEFSTSDFGGYNGYEPYYAQPYYAPAYPVAPPAAYYPAPAYAAPTYTPHWSPPNQPYMENGVRDEDGRYCREYQSNLQVAGGRGRGYGTACQQPDGSWEIIE